MLSVALGMKLNVETKKKKNYVSIKSTASKWNEQGYRSGKYEEKSSSDRPSQD